MHRGRRCISCVQVPLVLVGAVTPRGIPLNPSGGVATVARMLRTPFGKGQIRHRDKLRLIGRIIGRVADNDVCIAWQAVGVERHICVVVGDVRASIGKILHIRIRARNVHLAVELRAAVVRGDNGAKKEGYRLHLHFTTSHVTVEPLTTGRIFTPSAVIMPLSILIGAVLRI